MEAVFTALSLHLALSPMASLLAMPSFSDANWSVIVPTLTAVFAVSRYFKYRESIKMTGALPGLAVPWPNLSLIGFLWNWPLGPGMYMHWRHRKSFYRRFNSDVVALRPWLMGNPELYTNNVDVLRQVAVGSHKTSWWKPEEVSSALSYWGPSVFSVDGNDWRKHRRILGAAFNSALYELVLSKSMNLYDEMMAHERWNQVDNVDIQALQPYTFKFALMMVGICGLGMENISWSMPPATEDGSMTLLEALRTSVNEWLLYLVLPNWAFSLPSARLRDTGTAVRKMKQFLNEQVEKAKATSFDNSAFSMLIKASEAEGKLGLNNQELIGNIFILLFAGHETTAHTLAATLALLAIHQDIQDDVLAQIISEFGADGRPGTVEELYKLTKVNNAFMETLRLFPSGHNGIRQAHEDTILTVPKPLGEEGTYPVAIQKGTMVNFDMIGIHRNPRYFEDPEEYRPSRWEGVSPDSEQFTAFSVGARACIGRKFATVEAHAFIALFLRDWKVEPKMKKGETTVEWRDRVMEAKINLGLGVQDIPLLLTRRS
ncbi:cytochrome P450 [Flagelloscypha sp. PMI_526]|nr:cytochrome P450 [Flagelloscypha sp. PMI_526]